MNNNNYKCQLSYIILGFSVIVFYKLAKYFKLNKIIKESSYNSYEKEYFTDAISTSINDFISGNSMGTSVLSPSQAQGLSPTDLASYNQKLTDLINAINNLKNQQSTPPTSVGASPDNVKKLDLESQQQYQMFQIDYLNKQIQNAKDMINSQATSNSTNYKPIKIYSSCIIANADGSTSVDVPVTAQVTQSQSQSQSQSQLQSSAFQNLSTQQMLKTIGQGASQSSSSTNPNTVNLATSAGIFGTLINGIGSGNTSINV